MSEMLRSSYSEPLESQLDRLAEFIMAEVDGEPSQSQGAVDTAIRIMREQAEKLRLARDVIDLDLEMDRAASSHGTFAEWRGLHRSRTEAIGLFRRADQ